MTSQIKHPRQPVRSLSEFIEVLARQSSPYNRLYRGQSKDWPLLPSIARVQDGQDVPPEDFERAMLKELRRRQAFHHLATCSDLKLLAIAQHFGMKTRLLDWTENALAAIWFALQDACPGEPIFVYMLAIPPLDWIQATRPDATEVGPFQFADHSQALVYFPDHHHERIGAQQGAFTLHLRSRDDRFAPLSHNQIPGSYLFVYEFSEKAWPALPFQLLQLGVNAESLFPGIEGACKSIETRLRMSDRWDWFNKCQQITPPMTDPHTT